MDDALLDWVALGAAIRERREAAGLNPHQVAKRIGLGDAYLRRVEAGGVPGVGMAVILRIARALKTPADELLDAAGHPTSRRLAGELTQVYDDLGLIERTALLRIGHVLRDVRAEYESFHREDDGAVRLAPEQADQRIAETDAPYSDEDSEPTDILPPAAAPHKLQPVDPWPPLDPEADDEP